MAPRRRDLCWVLCIFGLIVVGGVLFFRALPVHSMDWHGIQSVKISESCGDWTIDIADKEVIKKLEGFGAGGHYETRIIKSGSTHMVEAQMTDGSIERWYVCDGGIGAKPVGVAQTMFISSTPGFGEWFQDLLRHYGH